MAACGNAPSTVRPGPTALPPPGTHFTSSSLCKTYFGSPSAIAKEFGVASLKLTGGGTEPQHPYSIFQCGYLNSGRGGDGLALTMTTKRFPTYPTVGGGVLYVGKSGVVYAYANTSQFWNRPAPRNIQVWLQEAEARAKPPPADGTITGVASPCTGPVLSSSYGKLMVTVYLSEKSRVLADQVVAGTHTYRFEAPAGHYVVSTHEGEGSKPVLVAVRPGTITHADIPSYCR